MVPQQILERPKAGFSPPINQWFKEDLRYVLFEYFNERNLEEMLPDLDSKKILHLRDLFLKGTRISAQPFLKIYLYFLWYQTSSNSHINNMVYA